MRRTLFPLAGTTTAPREVATRDPFTALQNELNRAFDDVWNTVGSPSGSIAPVPSVDVHEAGNSVIVTAELPGLSEDDVEVSFDRGVLRLTGEKSEKHENTDENSQIHVSERAYGRFERQLPIGREVDDDNIEARFDDGVLKVTLPKQQQAENAKKISVKRGQ